MARPKSGVHIDGDLAAASGFTGHMAGLSIAVRQPYYIGAVLEYVHSRLSRMADAYIDDIARAHPDNYHHVYEWGPDWDSRHALLGNPKGRLWDQYLKGAGANKTAGFTFKPSVVPSPVHPTLLKPGPSGKAVNENVHIFVWKAPVMEAGMDITVTPKMAKYLAYVGHNVSGGRDSGFRNRNSQGIAFSEGPVSFTAGGGETTARFTGAWTDYWNNVAPGDFQQYIAPHLTRNLLYAYKKGRLGERYGKRTKKSGTINVLNDSQIAFDAAKKEAEAQVKADARDYIAEAKRRRMSEYGY